MLSSRASQKIQHGLRSPVPSRHRNLVVPVKGCSTKSSVQVQVLESPITPKLPPQRAVAPPPEPAPVIHSRAFIIQNSKLPQRQSQTEQDASRLEASYAASPGSAPEGSLKAIIQKMDQQLNEIEANPPAVQKALFDISQGPLGAATSKGISAAAKLTVKATVEAARIAAPVGKWAFQEGMKAAMKLLAKTAEDKQPTGTRKISKRS